MLSHNRYLFYCKLHRLVVLCNLLRVEEVLQIKEGCYNTVSHSNRGSVWCCKTYRRQPVSVRFYSEQLLLHSIQRLAKLPSCTQLQQRPSSSIRTGNTVRQTEPLSALLKNCTHPDNCRALTRLPEISQTLRERLRMRSPCAAPTSHYPAAPPVPPRPPPPADKCSH